MSTPLVRSTEDGNLDVGTAPKKKQKITKWLVVKVAIILVITIALFFVGHYAIPRAPLPPGFRQPTDGESAGLIIVTISEAAVTGVGLAFLVGYARYLPKTPKAIKPKIYGIYISISYFLIQWFPHAQLHKMFGPNVNALIGLEMSFHWVNVVALSILAYYQFEIMMLCMALTRTKENLARLERGEKTKEEINESEKKQQSPLKQFVVNTKVHIVVITIIFFFALFFGVSRAFPPPPLEVTETQAGLFIAIEVVSAITFGIGAAFTILMAINISRNIAPRYQRTAWASYVAICYIFLTDYFHGKAHNSNGPDNYIGEIIIDIFFHIGVTAAAFILIWYQRKIIKAAWMRRQKRDVVGTSVTVSTGGQGQSSTKKDDSV